MECPYCNSENRDGVRYCANCGELVQAAPAVAGGSPTPLVNALGNSPSLTPGSRLQGGRYVIKKVLGQGGMGAALLATDLRLDSKPVVIKELISSNTDPARSQDDIRNFKREVSMLAHLDHPLVPNVTDHFQEGPRYFMVQEYVDGENLEERMEHTNQPMKERDALGYAWEVLDILDYLAQQTPPIVHRDIKPANIIIGTKDKRAHLVDFGIARKQPKQTAALGTPGYAPPEQYQGNADPRSDLYALGATLHCLLTNRDPRSHAPFAYPAVRTLNPDLSPETERVLTRALTNDINQRYQSAGAMKQDIYDILLNRFGLLGNASTYGMGTSGATEAVSATSMPTLAGSSPTVTNQPTQAPLLPPPPPPVSLTPAVPLPPLPPYPYQQQPLGAFGQSPGAYGPQGQPVRQRAKSHLVRNIFLLLLAFLLVIGLVYAVLFLLRGGSSSTTTNGIGVSRAANGESIGISDGTFAFDSSRPDGNLKRQAADKLKMGDVSGAESLWQSGLQQDTSDAEALIYLENQRVLASGSPYITLVVGTILTGDNTGVGRDDLQGAYVAQKEFNDGFKLPNNVQVRLLIANAGGKATDAATVAQQIVQAAQQDKTIVGVMGWPFSQHAVDAIAVLDKAHIPLLSQTASSDLLTNKSPYFFRVAPSNQSQGIAGAQYVERRLNAKRVALFVDPVNAYSGSLANDFQQQFVADGNGDTIVATENYTVGAQGRGILPTLLQEALSHNPDVIYFSGYANDVSVLLANLPTAGPFAKLQIMGGDALYELGGYPSSARAGFNRLHFTAFAYPDEWDVQGLTAQKPAFFAEYARAFNPNGQHAGGEYGYTRTANDVMLSYDATLALLTASKIALSSGGGNSKGFTPGQLQQALTQITGAQTLQGVSGRIAFGPDGNPLNKAFVVLFVDAQGRIHEESLQGCFLVGSSCS